MLNLLILQYPNRASMTNLASLPIVFFFFLANYERFFQQQGLAKWHVALDFHFNEVKVTVNAQKRYFQE